MSDHVEMKRTASPRIHISGMDRERLGNERADLLEAALNDRDRQLATLSRELQRAAAREAVMREALDCAEDEIGGYDCDGARATGLTAETAEKVRAALATPSPRAARLLAVTDAAKRVERGLSRSRAGDRVDVCANGTDPLDAFDLLALLRDVLAAMESAHE